MPRAIPATTICFACLVFLTSSVWARPEHKEALTRYYEPHLAARMQDCRTCHRISAGVDPETLVQMPPHNAFGHRLAELGKQWQAADKPFDLGSRLERVADEDADGDGVPNELELLAGRAPGIAADRPSEAELASAAPLLDEFRSRYRWRPLEAVERPAVPNVARAEWVRTPIDAFIAAVHQERGLEPAPEAPRHILLRRLYLDLTGLPPTRAELHAFLADERPNAYDQVVDRLLASPQYGERWGRHWMDIWRYSDWAGWTDGGQVRDSQPHIWRWRDWIIESLNSDQGYDQMVVEMLAADELHPTDASSLRATGYLVRNYKMLSRETWMQDVVNHTAQAFLGMTLACARCHDHMYDPISQEEYYRVRAIFEPHQVRIDPLGHELDTKQDGLARAYDADLEAATYLFLRGDDRQPDKNHPLAPAMPAAWGALELDVQPVPLSHEAYYPGLRPEIRAAMLADHQAQVDAARSKLEQVRAEQQPADVALAEKTLAAALARLTALQARIAADQARYAEPPADDASELARAAGAAQREANLADAHEQLLRARQQHEQAAHDAKPEDQKSQDALKKAQAKLEDAEKQLQTAEQLATEATDQYEPLTPIYPATSTGRRLALARWISDPRNPLTARVAVNHIWGRHFGQAIVPSVFDFGNNGRAPTHPALLDWLAAEFMEPTWNGKAGLQASPWSMKHLHRLIVTSSSYRMDSVATAENIEQDRDNMYLTRVPLRRMEAEVVRDSVLHVAGRLDASMGGPELDQNAGLEVNRRSLYFRHAAEKQMQLLKIFDAAAVSECYERKESIIPQQALALINGELTVVSARALARNLSRQCPTDSPADFSAAAFETVLSRPATPEEIQVCVAYLTEQAAVLKDIGERLSDASSDPRDVSKPAADPALRAQENLVHVLMNHNDFVTIR